MATASRLQLPSSAALLKAFVDAFDLRAYDPRLAEDRSVRAFLDGQRHDPEVAERAYEYIAAAVIKADLFPADLRLADVVPAKVLTKLTPARAASAFIRVEAGRWEAVRAAAREQTAPVAFPSLARDAVIRLFAVDLALRLAAAVWLVRHEVGERPRLDWLSPDGIRDRLRALAKAAGVTRAAIVERLGVHEHTVDDWLDSGTRPSRAHLEGLARAVAGNARAEDIRRELHIAYACRALVVAGDGRVDVADCALHVMNFTGQLVTLLSRSRSTRADNDRAMRDTLVLGADPTLAWLPSMLRVLLRNEPDPVWRSSLRAVAEGDWLPELQRVFRALGPVSSQDRDALEKMWGRDVNDEDLATLAYLAQARRDEIAIDPDLASLLGQRLGDSTAAFDLKTLAQEVVGSDPAVELLAEAARLDPTSADAHFRLGATLCMVDRHDEALTELRIAVQLAPHWDRPRVEVAIVLGNRGRHDAALEELRRAERALPATTPWVVLHAAYSLEQLGRVDEALAEYRRHAELQPSDGEALDRLAHLLFVIGEKVEARRVAKEAARLGIATVLRAWQRGHYGGPGPYLRPAHPGGLPTHFGPRLPWRMSS